MYLATPMEFPYANAPLAKAWQVTVSGDPYEGRTSQGSDIIIWS